MFCRISTCWDRLTSESLCSGSSHHYCFLVSETPWQTCLSSQFMIWKCPTLWDHHSLMQKVHWFLLSPHGLGADGSRVIIWPVCFHLPDPQTWVTFYYCTNSIACLISWLPKLILSFLTLNKKAKMNRFLRKLRNY